VMRPVQRGAVYGISLWTQLDFISFLGGHQFHPSVHSPSASNSILNLSECTLALSLAQPANTPAVCDRKLLAGFLFFPFPLFSQRSRASHLIRQPYSIRRSISQPVQ
jgi:hypothetical protein